MKAFFAAAGAGITGGMMYNSAPAAAASPVHCDAAKPQAPFSPSEFRNFPLVNVYDESPDTKILRFALPEGDQQMGMELCSCIVMKYTGKDGKDVIRPYTPISRIDQQGYFEILVKCYKGAKMGNHLHSLKIGATVEMKGPYVKFAYKPGQYKHIGCIAAGSGITPMFQLIRSALAEKNPADISMIYANRRKEDILLGAELNDLTNQFPSFSPYYLLSQPPKSWMGGVGHVTKDMIQAYMPSAARVNDSVVLVSGPPKFMQAVCGDKSFKTQPPTQGDLSGLLHEMGYSSKQVYKF